MELNTMLREHARTGLQTRLDAATVAGDTEQVRKIAGELAQLEAALAPKAAPYGDAEIVAELNKQAWFGVDPKKTAKAKEFGKTLDISKFANAAAFAEALVKAVDAEFAPPVAAPKPGEEAGDDDGGEGDDGEGAAGDTKPPKKEKRTDAPGEHDAGGGRGTPRGPWKKMSDAPPDVQKEINRQADKFVSSNAPKEQREKYIANALAAQYNAAQLRKKGK